MRRHDDLDGGLEGFERLSNDLSSFGSRNLEFLLIKCLYLFDRPPHGACIIVSRRFVGRNEVDDVHGVS